MQSRRDFIQRAALLSGSLGTIAAIPPSLLRALEIGPKDGSTFMDAEHVVILMQENRSFDHAFGTLSGVRGFDDPRAITTPGGNPVWLQTDAAGRTFAPFGLNIHGTKATWMGDLPHDRGSEIAAGNKGRHDQWLKVMHSGTKDYAEMPLTLGHYERRDIPFYHAFADAFTICDQHFCSAQTCTTPNRLFLWTGTNRDPRDPSAPVVLRNQQVDLDSPADWPTFPERLEANGVSWKIYQNEITMPTGLGPGESAWLENFGDNPMEYFTQYHVEFHPAHLSHLQDRRAALEMTIRRLEAGDQIPEENMDLYSAKEALTALETEIGRCSPENFLKLPEWERSLHRKAFSTNTGDPDHRRLETLVYQDDGMERRMEVPAGDVLHQFRQDVDQGKLPAVSWLVAPANFSDHPSAPWYGAWYVSEVLDILTRDPEVWRKTILILTYDENDGYYDHVPPFVPPHPADAGSGAVSGDLDTTGEFDELGHPIGLGYRVPMVIASPWSRGGNVCSQVFDHTSVLRFLEVLLKGRTPQPIVETNISAWRRTICGDLTSTFQPAGAGPAKNPLPLERDTFVGAIHNARFKDAPAGFRSLTPEEISEIRQDPAGSPLLPRQEPGTRTSLALPYELHADGWLSKDGTTFSIIFRTGERSAGAPFQVYAPGNFLSSRTDRDPGVEEDAVIHEAARRWSFAVEAGREVRYSWPVASFENGVYHLRVYGPNGFYREFRGTAGDPPILVLPDYVPQGPAIRLAVANRQSSGDLACSVEDVSYGRPAVALAIPAGGHATLPLDLADSSGWYDFTLHIAGHGPFSRRWAGRVETGKAGTTDPLIGRGATKTVLQEEPGTEPSTRRN
ncbi:phospholipase C, phosphocholine-specific [Luteolibacter sp. SL250]|uniref:phosphocholine-specific phospholipase C n=1 Tax=Luteolibacter sp. SL250 TaxID=2995170 RepID=UPI00226E4CE6|nr:phospholipase C, phosphocholine-specific [Luteolibacter sp. SL250]WAC19727.1 phospholipase C, phosphocholine-specific [Luteolibacter sp. SL250]